MLAAHVGVVPVQVGLLGREQVQVPLAGGAVGVRRARPGLAGERADGQWLGVSRRPVRAVAEPEALALGAAGAGGERRLEPGVLVADVVGDDVDDGADAEGERLLDQQLGLAQGAEVGVDVAVVADVVAAVGERAGIPRA